MRLTPLSISFVLLGGLATGTPAGAQSWTPIDLPTTEDIFAIENTYLANHWVVGGHGFAARSSGDRGEWTAQYVETDAPLYSVVEPTGGEVWLGAGHGSVRLRVYQFLFHRDIPDSADFRLFTRSGASAVAVGDGGRIYVTTDAGNSWTKVESGTNANLNAGDGFPTGPAWAVGDGGTILKTADGVTWTAVESGTTANLYGIAQPHTDPSRVYVVGDAGTILRSTDGGETWSAMPSGTNATLRAVSFSKENEDHLLAAGLGGAVLRSADGGENWCTLQAPAHDYYAAEAVTDSEFLIAGPGGLLLRTLDGDGDCGAPSAVGPEESPAPALRLEGPFPQPSRSFAVLRMPAREGTAFGAQVYDLSGRLLLDVPEKVATSSEDRAITFDTSRWAAGVYLVRVRSAGSEAVKRLVVTR
ncbi:MAG: YCF48-related protein [Candidatus Eisenbacteria bacterium]